MGRSPYGAKAWQLLIPLIIAVLRRPQRLSHESFDIPLVRTSYGNMTVSTNIREESFGF